MKIYADLPSKVAVQKHGMTRTYGYCMMMNYTLVVL